MSKQPFVCTKEKPWAPEMVAVAVTHPDAVLVREVYDWSADHNDYEIRRCPHCGKTFEVAIPT